ncbi:MAG: GIY-YIG nuclease family protein, partial [Pseudolabrys sp.]
MSNLRNGTLYVGVTSDLVRRCYEHRNSLLRGFTKQYGLKKLVYLNGTMIRAVIQ